MGHVGSQAAADAASQLVATRQLASCGQPVRQSAGRPAITCCFPCLIAIYSNLDQFIATVILLEN